MTRRLEVLRAKLNTRSGRVKFLKKFKKELRRSRRIGDISGKEFSEQKRAAEKLNQQDKARQVIKAAGSGEVQISAKDLQSARETLDPQLREERITREREATRQQELSKGATVQVLEQTQEGQLRSFKGKVVDEGGRVLAVRTVAKEEQDIREKERALAEARRGLRPVGEQPPKEVILKKPETKEELVKQFRLGQALPVPAAIQRTTGGTVVIRKETIKAPKQVPIALTPAQKFIQGVTTPVDVSKVPVVGKLQATFQTFRAIQRFSGEQRLERGRKKLEEGRGFRFPVISDLRTGETKFANLDTIIGSTNIFISENIGQLEEDIRRPSTVLTVGVFKGVDKLLGAIPKAGRFLRGGVGLGAGGLFISSEAAQISRGEKTFAQSLGTLEAFLVTEKFLSAGTKAVSNRLRTLNKKFIPAEEVFDISVLQQEQTFPTTKSTAEALKEFRKVTGEEGFEVVTATARQFEKVTTIQPGPKGASGLEDPGLFVTPRGRASPAFLRVPGFETPEAVTQFKLFPEATKPQLVEITNIEAIRRLPRSVREAPGFEPVAEFFKTQAEPSVAFITKRSEIGLGTTPRIPFEASADFISPIPRTVIRSGRQVKVPKGGKIKLGDILTPGGTGELEAVVPPQQIFEPLPSKRFTRFLNEIIPIREFKTTGEISRPGEIPKSFEAFAKETQIGESSIASLIGRSRIVSPSSIFPAVPIFSPVPSRVSRPTSLSRLVSSLGSEFSQVSQPSDISVSQSLSELSSSISASEISRSQSDVSKSLSQRSSDLSTSISKSISELSPSVSLSTSELSVSPSELTPRPRLRPRRRGIRGEGKGFNSYGLRGATTKAPMWVKLNKKPIASRSQAERLRNRALDNTVARSGKTVPVGSKFDNTKFKPRDKIIIPRKEPFNPFDQIFSSKFRSFRIKGGKQKPLPEGHVIENTFAAIDTPGEKKGLSLAKFKAQQRKQPQRKQPNINPLANMFGSPKPIMKNKKGLDKLRKNNINNIDDMFKQFF